VLVVVLPGPVVVLPSGGALTVRLWAPWALARRRPLPPPSNSGPNLPSSCGSDRHLYIIVAQPATVTTPSLLTAPTSSPVRLRASSSIHRPHVVAGARLPSSQARPNDSAKCGGDQHYRCAPSVVAGESERLREVWQRPALPMRASHRRGRVRTAP
jgi:hypothetical protein